MAPVGRDHILTEFREALNSGFGAPARAILLAGTRGIGKTVLLNELEDTAKTAGWCVIEESALTGIADRLVLEHLPRLLETIDDSPTKRSITGISAVGIGGITTQIQDKYELRPSLRHQLTDALEILTQRNSGLVLTIDEVTASTANELAAILAVVQHMFRERRNFAIAMAGLPEEVEALLQHPGVTFVRRALRFDLGAVSRTEAQRGLVEPVVRSGASWDATALGQAVAATRGFPFLIQLIGFYSWAKMTEQDLSVLGTAEVAWGIDRANDNLINLVIEPVLRPLPALERDFLEAMAESDGPARTGEIAHRLGKGLDTISHYGRKLITKHIIFSPRRGNYDFAIPGMRDYFRLRPNSPSGPNFW